jgi:parallel beta-helix repeat protein
MKHITFGVLTITLVLACTQVRKAGATSPCDDGYIDVPSEYFTIQDGVDAAASGCLTVRVAAGTYHENVVIDGKNVALIGSGDAQTLLQAVYVPNPDIHNPDSASALVFRNVSSAASVEGFKIFGAQYYGVFLRDASAKITQNTVTGNLGSVDVLGYSQPSITYNTFGDNTDWGIGTGDSSGGYTIAHNTFFNNGDSGGDSAVFLRYHAPSPVIVRDNIFYDGRIGFRALDDASFTLSNNLFYGNVETQAYINTTPYDTADAIKTV